MFSSPPMPPLAAPAPPKHAAQRLRSDVVDYPQRDPAQIVEAQAAFADRAKQALFERILNFLDVLDKCLGIGAHANNHGIAPHRRQN